VPASRGGQRRPPYPHGLVFSPEESSEKFLQGIPGTRYYKLLQNHRPWHFVILSESEESSIFNKF
jgi:hypothetical protein